MYINPFVAGIITTILVELVGLFGVAIVVALKGEKDCGDDDF